MAEIKEAIKLDPASTYAEIVDFYDVLVEAGYDNLSGYLHHYTAFQGVVDFWVGIGAPVSSSPNWQEFVDQYASFIQFENNSVDSEE